MAAAANSTKPPGGGDGVEFNNIASAISKDINITVAKLTKLNTSTSCFPFAALLITFTTVVQRKTLFNDPTQQINELVTSVKQDIGKLNQNLGETEVG